MRQTATVAEAVFVRGEVGVQRSASAPSDVLRTGDTLRAGDRVVTGPEATLTLRFADGSRLLVAPDSEVAVTRLLSVGRAARPSLQLLLERGAAEARVVPGSGTGPRFEIRTPAVNLGVRGTEFRARVDASRAVTWAEVTAGRVTVTGPADTPRPRAADPGVMLDAGRGVVVEAGQPPGAPQPLVAPPDLGAVPALIERLPLRFTWPALAGASRYRAQILSAAPDDHLVLDGVFGESAARWADLPDGTYRLRARALDARAIEGLDATASFELNARPEPPFVAGPAPGGLVRGEAALLRWARSTAATRYRLQVSTTPDFTAPQIDRSDLTDTSPSLPLPPGTYHWRVASIAADGDLGPFGDAQSFTLTPEPASPVLEAPQAATEGWVFRWPAPAAGERVRFQVASDAGFTRLILDETTDGAQAVLKEPEPGTYYLRARTVAADGFEGPYGATQQVEVPSNRPWWLLAPGGLLLLLLL